LAEALYEEGSVYVLFLSRSVAPVPPATDYYWTTGAWQGSFRVLDGRVRSRGELGESPPSSLKARGQQLGDFLDAVRKAVEENGG